MDVSNLWTDVRICWNGISGEMMKTPEELAEEYADSGLYRLKRYVDGRIKPKQGELGWQNRACKNGFLAGYKAAQEQLADADKVMPDTSSSATLNNWVSVKDRLPGDASDVLIVWADGVSEACFCDEIWCREGRMLRSVTHWMLLPEPPKEEND